MRIYYNNGSGSYGAAQIIVDGKGLYSGVVYDIDGDGDLDIAGQNQYAGSSKPYVYENLLDPVEPPLPPPTPSIPTGEFVLPPIILLLDEN